MFPLSIKKFQDENGERRASDLHGHAWSVHFRDPEGNRIEVYCDTPWYVDQPIQEEMDFGLPEAEIFQRSEALARSLPGFKMAEDWRRDTARAIADYVPE